MRVGRREGEAWGGWVPQGLEVVRRLVFETSAVASGTELNKAFPAPAQDISIVCMDGFDFIRRLEAVSAADTVRRQRRARTVWRQGISRQGVLRQDFNFPAAFASEDGDFECGGS